MDTIRCPMCGGELKECSHVLAFLAAEVSRLEPIIGDRDAEIMSLVEKLETIRDAYPKASYSSRVGER